MHPWVAFTGLILLWTDAVVSYPRVSGVEGQSPTLPCTYSTDKEVTTMCWGRGECPISWCSDQFIGTDGYRVTFQGNMRYELNGMISKGNVSLTIRNAAVSDSGVYCCRIERTGWFNDLKFNILLEIKPAPPKVTSVPTSAKVSTSAPMTPASTPKLTTAPPNVTSVPTTARASTSAPTTPASMSKLTPAPPNVTSVPTTARASTSAPTTPASMSKLTPAPPNVTSVPITARASTSAPMTPASTLKLTTAPPKITSAPTSNRASTTTPMTPTSMLKLNTAPSNVTSVLTSTRVSTSAPKMLASTPKLTTAMSPSPVQTTETQPMTPQGTSTTSLPLNPCLTDGDGTVAHSSDGVWQYNNTHMCQKHTPQKNTKNTKKALYIGISATAMILLVILAAIITKKYLCTERKVLQISKISSNDSKNGRLQNAAAVHYEADENVYIENGLYKEH